MSSLFDIERVFGTDLRPDVVMIFGRFGKRKQAIELCNDISIDLNLRDKLLHSRHQFGEESFFKRPNFLISSENLLFILFQLLCYITLGLC